MFGTDASPPQPTAFSVTLPTSSSAVGFVWEGSNCAGVVAAYEIDYTLDGQSYSRNTSQTTVNATTAYSETGLCPNNLLSEVKLFAVSVGGTRDPQGVVLGTPADARTAEADPAPPGSVTLASVDSSRVNVSWTAPASCLGDQRITSYRVTYSVQTGSSSGRVVDAGTGSPTSLHFVIGSGGVSPALCPASTVSAVHVETVNSHDGRTSTPVQPSGPTTAQTTSAPLPSPTLAVLSGSASLVMDVAWTAPNCDGPKYLQTYFIEYTTPDGTTEVDTLATTTSFTLGGNGGSPVSGPLCPSTSVSNARVLASTTIDGVDFNSTYSTPAATLTTATGSPPAATGLSLSAGAGQFTLAWQKPCNGPVGDYKVAYKLPDGNERVRNTDSSTATSFTQSGLCPANLVSDLRVITVSAVSQDETSTSSYNAPSPATATTDGAFCVVSCVRGSRALTAIHRCRRRWSSQC